MKTKIFEKINDNSIDRKKLLIKSLVDNNLPLYEKLIQLRDSMEIVKLTPNGENELVLLLFQNMANKIYFPRRGDNSERFDGIVEIKNYKVVFEIEIPSSAILDAPRNLLDDYAVLKGRKNEKNTYLIPLVICWDLPNKRTDYWNVISDIDNVLNIKIKTISILALAFCYWTSSDINFTNDSYFLNNRNSTMHETIKLLETKGILEDEFAGYFRPFK
ncbi:MAG: hypothetical protein ACLSXK_03640 [Lactococcus petauri]